MPRSSFHCSIAGLLVGCVSAVFLSAVAVPSLAEEPTAEKRALAEVLFRDAKALSGKEKFDEACPKFQESHRLDPKPGTILNLAVCHEKQGKTASAWLDYLEASSLAARLGQKDREAFAKDRAAALEQQLSRLKVQVPESTTGMVIKLDDVELSSAAWGTASPINPGEHKIEVTAPGYQTHLKTVTVDKGPTTIEVIIPKLEPIATQTPSGNGSATPVSTIPVPTTTAPPPPPPPPPPPVIVPPPDVRGSKQLLWIGAGAGAVGVVGIILGSVYGSRTFSLRDAGNEECGPGSENTYCTQKGLDLHEQAQTSATISTVGFAVGAAGLGAGAVLVLMSLKATPPSPNRAWIVPAVGPRNAGFAAGFAF